MSSTQGSDKNSFNLNSNNRQRDGRILGDNEVPSFSWQEHAYERLKVLYGVGKLLASSDDLHKTFPEILRLCEKSFPFLTAIMMEKRGDELNTIVWNTENVSQTKIDSAISNAKEYFVYLTNISLTKSDDFNMSNLVSEKLDGIRSEELVQSLATKNYCVIPLVVDQLSSFGVLQLEGSIRLNEKDLEFIGALADLIAISIDRHHKTTLVATKLSDSQKYVVDLESERALRENFVSILTHDLRTPLTLIKMSSELIKRHIEDSVAVQLYSKRINKSVERVDRMVTDLLDANRIHSGEKLPLKIELVDLSALVTKTMAELASVHGERFTLKIDESISGYWDPQGLRRTIENLCNNAIKYGSADALVTVLLTQSDNHAIIEVKNMGNPISLEDQKYLFQQFRRGRETAIEGWGIGLSLVRGVAEAHGGSVDVKSEIETGTIFTVCIPLDSRN